MPLADKIIDLRKKQGWSQIDLADRLDVSRQSVSKWEMAQAVPELDKIIKMSELFAVTTDYLLKDDAPGPDGDGSAPPPPPEEPPQPAAPEPEKETPPAAAKKPKRKKWPWLLAACLLLAAAVTGLLMAAGVLSYQTAPDVRSRVSVSNNTPAPLEEQPSPTPEPTPMITPASGLAEQAVIEEPAGTSQEQTAVSEPAAPETGMTEYTYQGDAMTAGGIGLKELAAIAEEYAPYGITCDEESGQWYMDGEPIRSFFDVLTSNGESLTGGRFHGTIRQYTMGGCFIDVRTVRDYDHCDEQGNGTLLYLESCDIRLEGEHWTEHHAQEHHEEEHHP